MVSTRLLGLTFCGGSSPLTSPGKPPSLLQAAISGLFSSYQLVQRAVSTSPRPCVLCSEIPGGCLEAIDSTVP